MYRLGRPPYKAQCQGKRQYLFVAIMDSSVSRQAIIYSSMSGQTIIYSSVSGSHSILCWRQTCIARCERKPPQPGGLLKLSVRGWFVHRLPTAPRNQNRCIHSLAKALCTALLAVACPVYLFVRASRIHSHFTCIHTHLHLQRHIQQFALILYSSIAVQLAIGPVALFGPAFPDICNLRRWLLQAPNSEGPPLSKLALESTSASS